MGPSQTLASTAVLLVLAAGSASAERIRAPEPVSPGAAEALSGVSTSCPTFTWGLGEQRAATGVLDLVVYRVDEAGGAEPVRVLGERLPASARAWTPSSERCLEHGATYAWSIGVKSASGDTLWSDARLFRVAAPALTPEAVKQALATLRGGLAATGAGPVAEASGETFPGATESEPGAARPASRVPESVPAGAAALFAELPDLTGVTFGLHGVSHSPDGFGILGHNDNGGVGVAASGAVDLLLDGLPAAALSETGFSRNSPGDLVFEFSNPGAGALSLEIEGADVLTDVTGAAKTHTHDGSDINDATLATGKVDPAEAVAGDAVMFDGANVIWGLPTAGQLGLPYSGTVASIEPALTLINTSGPAMQIQGGPPGPVLALQSPQGQGTTGLEVDGEFASGILVKGPSVIGLHVTEGARTGILVQPSATGIEVEEAFSGFVASAVRNGLVVNHASNEGVNVVKAGQPLKTNFPPSNPGLPQHGLGFSVDGAEKLGVWIGYAGQAGINIEEVGDPGTLAPGVRVGKSSGPGLHVGDSAVGLKIDTTASDGIVLGSTGADGIEIELAGGDGLTIGEATGHGVYVDTAFIGLKVANYTDTGLVVAGPAGGQAAIFDGKVNIREDLVVENDLSVIGTSILEDVHVNGTLTKPAGTFRIDHPVDPENRYLSHSFVESPDMMNVYNGNVVLDAAGRARVELPDWFEALNREFRYQLTPVGGPGPGLYVARRVEGNSFEIAGGEPSLEVSWQVTGVRRDAYAEAHRTPIETWKAPEDRGYYLHPAAFGLPRERGISHTRRASGAAPRILENPARNSEAR